jgi:hypothetical protein
LDESFDGLLLLLLLLELLLLFEVLPLLLLALFEFEIFSLLCDVMFVLDDMVLMALVELDEFDAFEFKAKLDVDVGKIFVSFISTLTNQYRLSATISFFVARCKRNVFKFNFKK